MRLKVRPFLPPENLASLFRTLQRQRKKKSIKQIKNRRSSLMDLRGLFWNDREIINDRTLNLNNIFFKYISITVSL